MLDKANPSFAISKRTARRFMLAHHHLWPPRQLTGKDGTLKLFNRTRIANFLMAGIKWHQFTRLKIGPIFPAGVP
jgi:hypothetical protein